MGDSTVLFDQTAHQRDYYIFNSAYQSEFTSQKCLNRLRQILILAFYHLHQSIKRLWDSMSYTVQLSFANVSGQAQYFACTD